jgi:hypothetical protein
VFMNIREVLTLTLAVGVGFSSIGHAQRRSPLGAAGKPKVDIVAGVGCVERRGGDPPTWWLSHAAEPKVTPSASFGTTEIEQMKMVPMGTGVYQLIGVSDFLDVDSLLQDPLRAQFTTRETANATGQLREGHRVVVKGPLVDVNGQKRINVMAVLGLADTCD